MALKVVVKQKRTRPEEGLSGIFFVQFSSISRLEHSLCLAGPGLCWHSEVDAREGFNLMNVSCKAPAVWVV